MATTTFSYIGQHAGRPIELTWTDGVLSGDKDAVELVALLAKGYEGMLLGQSVTGMSDHDHLQHPAVAASLMRSIFTGRPTMLGALPKISDPPKGAVL